MKQYELPKWKSGHCLPNCIIAAVTYFRGASLGNDARCLLDQMDISDTRWIWPATAVLVARRFNLKVALYDNDISYSKYVSGGLNWIKEKYGDVGVLHLKNRFDLKRTLEDSLQMIDDTGVMVYEREVEFDEIYSDANDTNRVFILNADHSSVHQNGGERFGHYFLVVGSKNDLLYILDPINSAKILLLDREGFEYSQRALNNETQHIIVSL